MKEQTSHDTAEHSKAWAQPHEATIFGTSGCLMGAVYTWPLHVTQIRWLSHLSKRFHLQLVI